MTPTAEAPPTLDDSKKWVPLRRIEENHETQVRGAINSKRVAELTTLAEEIGELDPVHIFYDRDPITPSTVLYVGDGFHRIAAYRGLNRERIPVMFHLGTKSEAIEFGLKRNCHHGFAMTKQEKRNAAEMAVLDARIGAYPDARIAKLIGVSPSLISVVRRGVALPSQREMKALEADREAESIEALEAPEPESPAASGKREAESPAPRSATVRQRKPLSEAATRPTKQAILKRIETELTTDCIDDDDLLALIKSPTGQYVFLPNDGELLRLVVVGASGRKTVDVQAELKSASFDQITVRYTAGKPRAE